MPEPQTLMTGIAFGESPRWHDDRLWFSDWDTQELVTVDLAGESEVVARVPSSPFCIDWMPDRRLLIVSGGDGRLLRREPDGSLVTHADLSRLSRYPWNEIVVDGRGNVYPTASTMADTTHDPASTLTSSRSPTGSRASAARYARWCTPPTPR